MSGLRPLRLILFFCFSYCFNFITHPYPIPPTSTTFIRKDFENTIISNVTTIQITLLDTIKICILGVLIVTVLAKFLFNLCNSVKFIMFTTNLSTRTKTNTNRKACIQPLIFSVLYGLLLTEYEESWFFLLCNLNIYSSCLKLPHKDTIKYFSRVLFILINLYIFCLSDSIICHTLCLITFQNFCYFFTKKYPPWLPAILIMLSNDVHQNPGPFHNSYFKFMNWNCNSIAKDDFQRLRLLEAQNSLFNYDLICLCETSLNDEVVLPNPDAYLNNEYTFIQANKPNNTRHGGVGLFYKNSLPLKIRDDLSFDESIVVELKYGRKKYFLLFFIGVLLLLTQPINLLISNLT